MSGTRHLVVVLGDQLDQESSAFDGFDPAKATGERACPFTTLYWDFLARHRAFLAKNARMLLQVKNLDRLSGETLREIRQRADSLRAVAG